MDGPRLGIVTQLSPLYVRLNGDTVQVAAEALDDFSGATIGVTEVVAVKAERRLFVSLVR